MTWVRGIITGLLLSMLACADPGEHESRSDDGESATEPNESADATTRDARPRADAASPPRVTDAAAGEESRAQRSLSDGATRGDGSAARALNTPDAAAPLPTQRDAGVPAAAPDAAAHCLAEGKLSYALARAAAPTAAQTAAYERITRAMDTAIEKYNCYANITRALKVSYEPSVATADGNVNGSIRFGSQASMNFVTAMHEIAHTLGIASNEYRAQVKDRVFQGPMATALLRSITGKDDDVVHTDGTHFWPYGLNYETEYTSESDAVHHCHMVEAIRADLGW